MGTMPQFVTDKFSILTYGIHCCFIEQKQTDRLLHACAIRYINNE